MNTSPTTLRFHRTVAAALALLAWFALVLQLVLSLQLAARNGQSAGSGIIVYLGYFTILTNLFVAIVCSAGALRGRHSRVYAPSIVGCTTTAILVVGVGYHVLLRTIWTPEGAQWLADVALHYAVPIGAALHWFVYPHASRLPASSLLFWCVYPVAYFIYALIRGALLHSYPYPFIDVDALGYARTFANAVGLLVAFVIAGCAVRAIANALARRVTLAAAR